MANLYRILFTLKSLKYKQIVYQIYYKFKFRRINILNYSKYYKCEINKVIIKSSSFFCNSNKCKKDQTFSFLHLMHKFKEHIDWNFQEYGKLWNYNLQYLDYITDEDLEIDFRRDLIKRISKSILLNELKPEPYPVSLRINNLILFDSIHGLNDDDAYFALKLQINFLCKNLEFHLLANHLLENYITLFIASYAIMDSKLNSKASRFILKELEEQILEDGGHFERSPMYHCIILQRLLLCIDVIENNNYFDNKIILDTLKKKCGLMLGWLNTFSFPDGSWPLVNDSAGYICLSKKNIDEFANFLNIDVIQTNLKSSGFRKLKSKEFEVLVNVGQITPEYQPGHAHSDMLSFYLWYDNKQVIVDTGVSTYESNQVRIDERSTRSHNTITINNTNQSDVWGGFRIGKKAKLLLKVDELDKLSAEVYHMHGCSSDTKHQRNFIISEDTLIVEDFVFTTKGEIINTIHFDSEVKPVLDRNMIYFENFNIKYTSGLKNLVINSYEQAISFNIRKTAFKMVASVDNFSTFIISKNK